jgi:hypothetical protein
MAAMTIRKWNHYDRFVWGKSCHGGGDLDRRHDSCGLRKKAVRKITAHSAGTISATIQQIVAHSGRMRQERTGRQGSDSVWPEHRAAAVVAVVTTATTAGSGSRYGSHDSRMNGSSKSAHQPSRLSCLLLGVPTAMTAAKNSCPSMDGTAVMTANDRLSRPS